MSMTFVTIPCRGKGPSGERIYRYEFELFLYGRRGQPPARLPFLFDPSIDYFTIPFRLLSGRGLPLPRINPPARLAASSAFANSGDWFTELNFQFCPEDWTPHGAPVPPFACRYCRVSTGHQVRGHLALGSVADHFNWSADRVRLVLSLRQDRYPSLMLPEPASS